MCVHKSRRADDCDCPFCAHSPSSPFCAPLPPPGAMQARQAVTLAVLWLSYAAVYLLRKPLGVGKSAMASDLGLEP